MPRSGRGERAHHSQLSRSSQYGQASTATPAFATRYRPRFKEGRGPTRPSPWRRGARGERARLLPTIFSRPGVRSPASPQPVRNRGAGRADRARAAVKIEKYAGRVNTAGPPRRGAIGITHLHTNYDTACYTPRIVHITCTTHRLKDTRTMHHYTRHRRHKPYDHRTPPLGSSLRSALLTARPSHIRHFAPPCRTCAAPAARRGRLPAAGLRPARAQAVRR